MLLPCFKKERKKRKVKQNHFCPLRWIWVEPIAFRSLKSEREFLRALLELRSRTPDAVSGLPVGPFTSF